MSFEPPAGILDIGNATLRVGKLEVAETSGLNQGLQNIVKNDLLITETTEYTTNQTWGLKLPTAWVGEFDIKGATGKYVEFNFYNEGSTSNAQGYTLHFEDTTLTLKYDNGSTLASATIPTIVGTYRKVNIFFERGVIAVSIDGARVLYFKESDTYNSVHGHPGMASRVASTTGGSFVNAFFESDHGGNSGFKNLRIVNGRFISDKTSNVSFIGSLGVGVNSPKESLDIRGNMHLTRVSNVSQVSVDSNVVTEYTGPHDRPLRKYPEVAMTADAATSSGYKGYKVTSSFHHASYQDWNAFDGVTDATVGWHTANSDSTIRYTGTDGEYNGTNATQLSSSSNTVNGEYLQIELPKAIKLKYYILYPQGTSGVDQYNSPKSAVLYGSNDGSAWTEVHRYTDEIYDTDRRAGIGYTFQVNSNQSYKYFAIVPTHRDNSTSTADTAGISIGELEYYGYEEGSGSLDTTLKTVYNVPATTGTQLEVYYDAKGESTVQSPIPDLSPNTNTGAVSGHSPTLDSTDGITSFVFDGTDDYITSTLTGLSSTQYTMAGWIKVDTLDSTINTFFGLGDWASGNGRAIGVAINDNNVIGANVKGLPDATFSEVVTGEWYHVVADFTSDNDTHLYVNGKLVDTVAGTTFAIPTNPPLFIGSRGNAAGTVETARLFPGSIANFRLYSKALNADQVKELYDYQKDYFLGSKSQVTLYKGHLGVGVTEPSGQLELAGDERIQAYPSRGMTHPDGTATGTHTTDVTKNITYIEGHGEFKASASLRSRQDVDYDGQQPYNAFDYTTNSYLLYGPGSGEDVGYNKTTGYYEDNEYQLSASSGTPYGHWLQLEMPYKINVKSYFIQHATNDYWPQDWQIWASNDDISWTHIHTYTGGTFDTDPQYYTVSHTGHYKIYTMIITRIKEGSSLDRVRIQELRYFGTPGPTTLDKGSLSLTRSLDVPRVSRYDVDTETPRPEKLVVDFDTTVNSSPTDISGKGSHGTFYNGASYSPADKAFNFDGTNDYIEAVTNLGSGNQNVSFSMWINTHTASRWFTWLGSEATAGGMGMYRGSSTYKIVVRSGTTLEISAGPLNTWEHLVFTYDSSNVFKGYVNGEPGTVVATVTDTVDVFTLASNPPIEIGARTTSSSEQYFDGQISNFKLYNAVLEPSEVKKLYNLGRTGRSMVISDTAVGIGKVPEAQLDVRGSLAVRGDVEAYGKNFNMSPAGNLSILGSIYGASVTAPYVRTHYDRYGFDGVWRTLIGTSAQDCGIGHLINETSHQYAVFWFAHAGNGTGYVGWIQNGGYNIAYSGSNIKVQGPVGTITRGYILFLNNG